MKWKTTDRIVAGAVFLYALILYILTVAPTASFWDAGEFIAAVHGLMVGHPPGAPFYMLIGRFFSMFVPAEYVALSVNLISVLSSAATVLLTHLIIVRLVREWQGREEKRTTQQRIAALAGGVIGACAFAVTDSFWFNAVEAEVYALSMFFTALVVWLIMRWSEQARHEEEMRRGGKSPFGLQANRYLVLIAYLFGLAIGVHLLNLLAVFFIALIIFFTEFDRPAWSAGKRFGALLLAGLASSVGFLTIYPGIVQKVPSWAGASGVPFLFLLGVAALLAFVVWYTHTRRLAMANLIAVCIAFVFIGYSTYALIYIRSAADPPIDLNNPETPESFVSYLEREQYGQTPLLTGPSFDESTGQLGRDEQLFPRRHSPVPSHWEVYQRYDSDLEYFIDYQVNHMYWRYFLWNFMGRQSDVQDAPAVSGLSLASTEESPIAPRRTPSEEESRNAYFLLPLLLGIAGFVIHIERDWRRALAVGVLFFITGLGIVLYLNQPPNQPRERDYSYVASFFAFSLWIGIGAAGILELVGSALSEKKKQLTRGGQGAMLGVGALLFLAVPAWMLQENYYDHDRSGRYIAVDYAYNMLQSVAPNAILFTNGDNDTYPLWYLQRVMGVRTDVRVVNLSLLQTPWYAVQLKHQSAGESEPLPISLSDDQLSEISYVRWQPAELRLPVDTGSFLESDSLLQTALDPSELNSTMQWTLRGRPFGGGQSVLYPNDLVVLDILRTNAKQGWTRPIYFAVTVSPEGQLDLQNFFQLEGMANRVVPIEHDNPIGRVVPGVTDERMDDFRFRNLGDPDVYYDANIRNMVDNYRTIYARVAENLAQENAPEAGRRLLETIRAEVPFETIPGDIFTFVSLARGYSSVGMRAEAVELMKLAEPLVLDQIETARSSRAQQIASQYVQMVRLTYLNSEAYEAAANFQNALADMLGDPSYRVTADELRQQYGSE